jgi:hypothetical protein
MVVVARARQFSGESVRDWNAEIGRLLKSKASKSQRSNGFLRYFEAECAASLREVANFVREELLADTPLDISSLAPEYCHALTAIFKTIRTLASPSFGSNPSWLKIKNRVKNRAIFTQEDFTNNLRANLALRGTTGNPNNTTILQASSTQIPLPANSVDFVVTSPPYCTRLDYVIATLLELLTMGISHNVDLRNLRKQTIGTTIIAAPPKAQRAEWGLTCLNFLRDLASHPSKESKGYYLRSHLQYFEMLFESIEEISRTLRSGAHTAMVVQSSRYKEIVNDLPQIIVEMMANNGSLLIDRLDFPTKRTLAQINKHSSRYNTGPVTATESVLLFIKQEGKA